MKFPAVVIPVKGGNPKSRLSGILGPEARKDLVRAMIQDVLKIVVEAGLLDRTFVVSPDQEILHFTSNSGARQIREARESGVNAAVEMAMHQTSDAEGWLVLPADIPFISRRDVSRALEFIEAGAKVVISPSRGLDGTNLLLFGSGTKMKLSYDRDSFRGHLASAAHSRFSVAVYCSKTILLDIDTVEDIELALASGVRNATTDFLESRLRRGG